MKKIKLYKEPELDEEGKPITKELTPEEEKEKLKMPLKEGVLKTNCGVPLVFVINKSDTIIEHQNNKKIEEDSEFILSHIRLLALEYGATIIYTSGKANINLTILYDYICHILFNFELPHKPNLIEKEAYFIPAGFDDLKSLNSNEEISNYLEEPYEFRIKPELKERQIMEEDIQCEDTNTFFEALQKKGIKGKENIQKPKIKEIKPSIIEQKKVEVNNDENKNKEIDLKNQIAKQDKKKIFEDKKKEVKEKIEKKKSETINNNPSDAKDSKKVNKVFDEKKNKTRENMLAKLKLKKDFMKKK